MLFDDELLDDDEDAQAVSVPASDGLPVPRDNPESMGHDDVESMLFQLLEEGKLPHALIFAGQKGIGKATMAYRLTRYLLSSPAGQDADTHDMFGTPAPAAKAENLFISKDDPVFRQVASGGNPDLLVVERPYDEKKDKHKDAIDIESARRIAPFMRMTPSKENGWRVVIVDDADTMNRQAQNAILKILEEPPKRAILILVTHRPGALIPTIRSRCRVVNFRPLPQAVFMALIRKLDASMDQESAMTLFAMTRGSVGHAGEIIEQGGMETLDRLTALLAQWPQIDWPSIHALADTVGRAGQEDQYRMLESMMTWIAETLVRVKAGTMPLPELLNRTESLLNSHTLERWIEIAEHIKDHFEQVTRSNLDKRQGVIGAFTILRG